MTDYKELRKHCEQNSRISGRVVDEFLLGYAARHQGLEKKMNQQFARYRHITGKFKKSSVEMFKSQFIIHRVFSEGGLIGKLLMNPALKRFKGEERDFLDQQVQVPWRFSFAEITGEPAKDFFSMKDVFSGQEYLLFSPGTTDLKASRTALLWFNLIGFNGACWQSYGPIASYRSFGPDDIYFFATELNPDIEYESEVYRDVERNPLPYIMLFSGANYPRSFHDMDEIMILMAEHDLEAIETEELKKKFRSEFDKGVYRFTHNKYGDPPHYAQFYLDENEKLLLFSAMTERGFNRLMKDFNDFGYDYPATPYLSVRLQMLTTAGEILKRKIRLNEYEELFQVEPDPEVSSAVENLNAFISIVLPDINEGRIPDIEEAARKTGVEMDTARDMVDMIMEKRNGFPGEGMARVRNGPAHEETERTERFGAIYHSIRAILKHEPWKYLYETDLFGVRMPGNGRVYFISVMGANGEYTAVAAYKGYEGLSGFLELQENADRLPKETILTIPHLILSFTDRGEVDKVNLEAIRNSGISFRGKGQWPLLQDIIPGYVPVFPEGETLKDLPLLFEQIASVLLWAGENPDLLYREGDAGDEILIRTPSGTKGMLSWENHYEIPDIRKGISDYKMTYSREACAGVSRLKVSSSTLQVDLVMLPAPVKEQGKKGIFPFVLLMVDKENGMIPGMAMLTPEPDLHSMHESVPQKLLEEIAKLEFRPEKIEFRSDFLFNLVQGALKKAWCMPVLVDEMPMMDDAVESLLGNIQDRDV